MSKLNSPWVAAVTASVIGAAVSIAVSNHLTQQQIQEGLPAAIDAHQAKQEAARIAEKKAEILAPWGKASDSSKPGKHFYGKLDAEFTLVEFSDLECPYCKRFHDTPKQLVDQAGGKINWEWQHYPLAFHNPAAEKAAHAAECVAEEVGNQAFWAFTGEWFTRTSLNGQGYSDLDLLARELGSEPKTFKECMSSGRFKDKIKKQIEQGTALGVTGTPATVVVDNTTGRQVLVKGAQAPQALLQAIGQLIEQRSQKEGSTNNSTPSQN